MLLLDAVNLLLGGFVTGVDLGGVQILRQSALLVAGIHQLAPFGQMQRRSRHPHTVERRAIAQILAILGAGLLIVIEGGVVVLARLGALPAFEVAGGRFGPQQYTRQPKAG